MCHTMLADASLQATLLEIDRDLAAQVRAAGCPSCGGRLDAGHYRRKPRGAPVGLDPGHAVRLSWCCSVEGCRRRALPPSVRFLGRRVYLGVVVVLVGILVHGLTDRRIEALRRHVGPSLSRRTVSRWRRWWRERFPRTRVWRALRGRVVPSVVREALPGSLLARLAGSDDRERVVVLLRLLAPLSASRSVRVAL